MTSQKKTPNHLSAQRYDIRTVYPFHRYPVTNPLHDTAKIEAKFRQFSNVSDYPHLLE